MNIIEIRIIFITFVSFFFLFSLFNLLNKKNDGKVEEKKVANLLNRLSKEYYIVINDLLLKTGNHTCQIDHLVLSVFGNFVIETKSYHAKIYEKRNKYWNAYYSNGQKQTLYNSLQQNWHHINTLKRISNNYNKKFYFHSIVVFNNNAELKTISPNIIKTKNLLNNILCYNQLIYTSAEISKLYEKIISFKLVFKIT